MPRTKITTEESYLISYQAAKSLADKKNAGITDIDEAVGAEMTAILGELRAVGVSESRRYAMVKEAQSDLIRMREG